MTTEQNILKDKREKINKILLDIFHKISYWFWLSLELMIMVFISALAGMRSETLIYLMNKPLGMQYAHFASYLETALMGYSLVYLLLKARSKK